MLAKRRKVTAFDVSAENIETARRLADANGVTIDFRRTAFESLELQDGSFDLAFGACVLHHVDIPAACRELARVLRPGGRAVFVENSARNALLMLARRFLVGSFGIPRYGDDDEHPLTPGDLAAIEAAFPGRLRVHHPDFLFFRLLDFYILRKGVASVTAMLRGLDHAMGRIPVEPLGYFQVIEIARP
jgi:SAM-dependent methyltransferase